MAWSPTTLEPAPLEMTWGRDDRRRRDRLLQDRMIPRPASRRAGCSPRRAARGSLRSAASSARAACFARTSSDTTPGSTPYVCPGREAPTPIRCASDARSRTGARAGTAITATRKRPETRDLPLRPRCTNDGPAPFSTPRNEDVSSTSHGRAPQSEAGGSSTAAARSSSTARSASSSRCGASEGASPCACLAANACAPTRSVHRACWYLSRALNILGVEVMTALRSNRLRKGYAALSGAHWGPGRLLGRVRRPMRPNA